MGDDLTMDDFTAALSWLFILGLAVIQVRKSSKKSALLWAPSSLHGEDKSPISLWLSMGWEAAFLIRAFGLSGELSTKVGFVFQRIGPWPIL